jgi:hypothetical protein
MPVEPSPFLPGFEIALLVLVGLLVLVLAYVWWRGRPFAAGDVFRASRLSAGNRLFPTQVRITPTSVIRYTPQWIGTREHSIHIAHVASVSIDTDIMFSHLHIETSGGTTPIACRGHRKKDALRIKELIEKYQTAYYRTGEPRPDAVPSRTATGTTPTRRQ